MNKIRVAEGLDGLNLNVCSSVEVDTVYVIVPERSFKVVVAIGVNETGSPAIGIGLGSESDSAAKLRYTPT
jgi:hypothetical protein